MTALTAVDTALEKPHYDHLISEGFTPEHIWSMEQKGVCSYSKNKAMTKGFKVWADDHWESSSGLYFPFTQTFGQIRCDQALNRGGKPTKYLTPCGAKTQPYLPSDCNVITEGWKDAERPNQAGCSFKTGCVAGVSHIKKALPKNGGHVVLFDSDGWQNPSVARSLLKAAIHLNSKIQLVPEIENEPKAGLCEYFKVGYSVADYEELISNALHPDQFIFEWAQRFKHYPSQLKAKCTQVATLYTLHIGQVA